MGEDYHFLHCCYSHLDSSDDWAENGSSGGSNADDGGGGDVDDGEEDEEEEDSSESMETETSGTTAAVQTKVKKTKPPKVEAKKKKRHVNIVFIGHVGECRMLYSKILNKFFAPIVLSSRFHVLFYHFKSIVSHGGSIFTFF